jgi:hypothetical protein
MRRDQFERRILIPPFIPLFEVKTAYPQQPNARIIAFYSGSTATDRREDSNPLAAFQPC